MKAYKYATHLTFACLADKRRFCSLMNKFRRAGLITIVDLGKDEDGISVEFAFQEEAQLRKFEEVVGKNANSMAIYRK